MLFGLTLAVSNKSGVLNALGPSLTYLLHMESFLVTEGQLPNCLNVILVSNQSTLDHNQGSQIFSFHRKGGNLLSFSIHLFNSC